MRDAGDVLVEAATAMAAAMTGGLPQPEAEEEDDEEEGAEADAEVDPPQRVGTGTTG